MANEHDQAIQQRQRETQQQMGLGYGGDPNLFGLQDAGGAGGWNDQLSQLLQGWQGKASHIPEHLQKFAPFFFANLLKTPEAQRLMDVNKMTAYSYAPAAAQIQQGSSAALRAAQGNLAASGLDVTGAYPALQAQIQTQAAGQGGDILNRLLQENAYGSWGMVRDVAGMGFGYGPMGQQRSSFDWGPMAQAAGQVVGSYVGSGFNGGGK